MLQILGLIVGSWLALSALCAVLLSAFLRANKNGPSPARATRSSRGRMDNVFAAKV
ncbi:hypothetical protein BH09ACT10_BH09ACT10_20130 [soil metagenome]